MFIPSKDGFNTYFELKIISSLIMFSFLLTFPMMSTPYSKAFISQNMFGGILPNNPVITTPLIPQQGFGYGGAPAFGYGGIQNGFTSGLLGMLPQVLNLGSLFGSSPNPGFGSGYGEGYGDSIFDDNSYGYNQGYGSDFGSTFGSDPFGLGGDTYDEQGFGSTFGSDPFGLGGDTYDEQDYGMDSSEYGFDIPSEDLRDIDSLSGGSYFSDSAEDSSQSLFGDLFS
jgi:hypothetical protein